jgi:hypothetical protein
MKLLIPFVTSLKILLKLDLLAAQSQSQGSSARLYYSLQACNLISDSKFSFPAQSSMCQLHFNVSITCHTQTSRVKIRNPSSCREDSAALYLVRCDLRLRELDFTSWSLYSQFSATSSLVEMSKSRLVLQCVVQSSLLFRFCCSINVFLVL